MKWLCSSFLPRICNSTRGWALWKACFELKKLKDKKSFDAEKQKKIIFDVINEHLKDSSE